jgi:hypothetical protein
VHVLNAALQEEAVACQDEACAFQHEALAVQDDAFPFQYIAVDVQAPAPGAVQEEASAMRKVFLADALRIPAESFAFQYGLKAESFLEESAPDYLETQEETFDPLGE